LIETAKIGLFVINNWLSLPIAAGPTEIASRFHDRSLFVNFNVPTRVETKWEHKSFQSMKGDGRYYYSLSLRIHLSALDWATIAQCCGGQTSEDYNCISSLITFCQPKEGFAGIYYLSCLLPF
jgi:hypothetical protein